MRACLAQLVCLQVIHALENTFNQSTLKPVYSLALGTTPAMLSCRRPGVGGRCRRSRRFGSTTILRRRRRFSGVFSRLATSGFSSSSTLLCTFHLVLEALGLGASGGALQALDLLVVLDQRGKQFLAEYRWLLVHTSTWGKQYVPSTYRRVYVGLCRYHTKAWYIPVHLGMNSVHTTGRDPDDISGGPLSRCPFALHATF